MRGLFFYAKSMTNTPMAWFMKPFEGINYWYYQHDLQKKHGGIMLKDIDFKKVTDLALAVVPDNDDVVASDQWKVYLINLRKEPITSVMVSSEGYGTVDGKEVKTSALRQFIEHLGAEQYIAIEIITEELTLISNQFWVSFYIDGQLYDKKYVFVRESINEEFYTHIPLLEKKGVMIR